MKRCTVEKLQEGAVLLRFIATEDTHKQYPPYSNAVVLDPIGDGLGELKGLVRPITPRDFKNILEVAKNEGYTRIRFMRVDATGSPTLKYYTLGDAHDHNTE
jgi:hypothetical protein